VVHWTHSHDRVAFAKSRDVMLTLTVSMYCLWYCLFRSGTEAIAISDKAEKAEHNLGRIWTGYRSMPQIARHLMPASQRLGTSGQARIITMDERVSFIPGQADFKGSRLEAIASGPDKIQEYHPTIVFIDQVDTTRLLRDTLAAIFPVMKRGTKIIMVGCPHPGVWREICYDMDEMSSVRLSGPAEVVAA